MSVFRIEKNKGYTVMSNHHLRNPTLSLKAKGLLSQMLSLPEDWDYTLKGLSHINRESIDAIRTAVWELEEAGYIERRQARDKKGKMNGVEYIIYEQPHTKKDERPEQEKPMSDFPTSDDPTSENPTQINKDILNTELLNKDNLSFPISSNNIYNTDKTKGTDGKDILSVCRKTIENNIDYDLLSKDSRFEKAKLDEMTDIIFETVCTSRKKLRIAGDDYPAELVKAKFMKLNSRHIEYAIECMKENTTKILNMKQYLRAVLFNAPSTIDNYYSSLVSHDMANST